MPVYESIKNADNRIVISAANKDSVIFGWAKVIEELASKVSGNKNIALDGWYGIDFEKIAKALADNLKAKGVEAELIAASDLYKTREEIISYNQPYVTDDPGFGKVNKAGVIEDIMDADKVKAAKSKLSSSDTTVIIYGEGASIKEFADVVDVKCYIDNTHQKVQWDMWEGRLATFGQKVPTTGYNWKEYNYSDYYIILFHIFHLIFSAEFSSHRRYLRQAFLLLPLFFHSL